MPTVITFLRACALIICCCAITWSSELISPLFPQGQDLTAEDRQAGQNVVIALPGIGGRSDRSLFLRTQLRDGQQHGAVDIRSWQFQDGLQPSHLRRLQRRVPKCGLTITPDRLDGEFVVELQGPKQLGNPAVIYRAHLRIDLHPVSAAEERPDLRSDYSTPSWRRVDFPLHGQLWRGVLSGTWQRNDEPAQTIDALSWASTQSLPRPGGPAISGGDWPSGIAMGNQGSLQIHADLPEHPVSAAERAEVTWRTPAELPIAGANALRVRWRSPNYDQVRAGLVVYDHLGARWSMPGAMPLLGGEREALLPLSGLMPNWYTATFDFASDSLTGFGVTVPATYGPGSVEMELLSIEAVHLPELDHTRPREVSLRLEPSVILSSEGQRTIPPALMGVHGVGPVPDERQAAVAAMGIGSVRTITHTAFAPLSKKVRIGEQQQLLAATDSHRENAIHSFTMGLFDPPPWGDGIKPVIERLRAFGRSLGEHGYHPQDNPQGPRIIEFWNEPFMWGRHINKPYGTIHDPEQPGHYGGPLAAKQYAAMYRAMVEAAREHNPHIRFSGPSSSAFAADDWRHLQHFVLPIIERTHDLLDYVTEHHYQGRGRQFAAEWLVADSAIQGLTGRSIPIWNTEANDLSDTPGGWGDSDDRPQRAAERKRAAYQLDEIIAHLNFIPHLAQGRAIHMLHRGRMLNAGEAAALRFLAPLRGALTAVYSSDQRVPAVAARSLDGEDIIVVVYNDRHHPVQLQWDASSPQPTAEALLDWDSENGIAVRTLDGDQPPATLAPLAAIRYRLSAPPPRTLRQRQLRPAHAAEGDVLFTLAPGESIDLTVDDPPAGSPTALWVVGEYFAHGDAHVRFADGTKVALPAANDGPLMIRLVALPDGVDPSTIQVTAAADGLGGRLGTLVVVWEDDEELTDDSLVK